jgi:hypothetical protein
MKKMKPLLIIACWLFFICNCSTQKYYEGKKKLLIGKWISEDDSLSTITFAKRKVIWQYNQGEKREETYMVTKDTLFMNKRKYEILNLNKDVLSLMYYANGKIFLYLKTGNTNR